MTEGSHTNRLIEETSPYLLQHAYNPVDWYPWGEEALRRAREEDKPILLSIGYAACHWCHVMERESFEDPEVARVMNDNFVSIKVDREERPDIDAIYMDAVQAMTGHGGWPMTMFLTPQGVPFFGGTYFPPDARHGLPSFRKVLESVAEAWRTRRAEIEEQGGKLVDHIRAMTAAAPSTEPLTSSLLVSAAVQIGAGYDEVHGGFGGPPKFPQAPVLEFMLREPGRAQEMVTRTLRKMAYGGIYDQLGGGFHRYSIDEKWLVPHFEKMLYDNAQLARVYLHAWQATKDPLFRRIATETLDYLIRDMRDATAGFHSSEDADSEGIEGKFYIWSYEELKQIAPEAAEYYGATPQGNFEGSNILTAAADEAPEDARGRLLAARDPRVRPGRDDKVLTSWNGLAIAALAECGAAFGRADFIDASAAAATFLLETLRSADGQLLHSHRDGRARVLGMLEDYAYLADGLFSLWEATFDPRWIVECRRLADQMLERFWDPERGGLFSTASDHEQLIVRQKEIVESATPSAMAAASLVLQRLAVLFGEPEYATRGVDCLRLAHRHMEQAPQAVPTSLSALDFYLSTPKEVAILGDREDPAARRLAGVVWEQFLPNRVMAGAPPGIDSPLLEGKSIQDGTPTAFVCERYVCNSPTTDPAELAAQLS